MRTLPLSDRFTNHTKFSSSWSHCGGDGASGIGTDVSSKLFFTCLVRCH